MMFGFDAFYGSDFVLSMKSCTLVWCSQGCVSYCFSYDLYSYFFCPISVVIIIHALPSHLAFCYLSIFPFFFPRDLQNFVIFTFIQSSHFSSIFLSSYIFSPPPLLVFFSRYIVLFSSPFSVYFLTFSFRVPSIYLFLFLSLSFHSLFSPIFLLSSPYSSFPFPCLHQ